MKLSSDTERVILSIMMLYFFVNSDILNKKASL